MREFSAAFHPGQMAIYNSDARFKVVAAGRRFGKSHLAALLLAIFCLASEHTAKSGYTYNLTNENGVYYVAPTFDQAKRIMWPKLHNLLGFEAQGGLIRRENVNDGWIELISGRKIFIKGADNPEALRGMGYHYVVLDEFADMKQFVWDEIIDPALMDIEGEAMFIGTPKGKNHFYKMFMLALTYDQEKAGDSYRMWEAFHFKSGDNPMLPKNELHRMMNKDSASRESVRQEIEADFVTGGAKILNPNDFRIVNNIPQGGRRGKYYVTCDLAGFSRDRRGKVSRTDESVIATTWVEDQTGDWYIVNILHGRWDARETALRIVKTCNRYLGCRLGIEQGITHNAVLPYIDDYMREFHRYVTVEPLKHGGVNKYSRIEWALQGRSQRGKIHLVQDDWNQWFLDQCADFPDPLSHDDGIDAVAYVDQMASISFVDMDDIPEWEALDVDSGY